MTNIIKICLKLLFQFQSLQSKTIIDKIYINEKKLELGGF